MKSRYTISVDFDGTIVHHRFPEIGELKPGAKDALTRLIEKYDIVISSCRASALFRKKPDGLSVDRLTYIAERHASSRFPHFDSAAFATDVEEYLHELRDGAIPDMVRADGRDYVAEMKKFLDDNGIPYTRIDNGDEGKVVAVAYIDDRAILYGGSAYEWEAIAKQLLAHGSVQ